MAFNLKTFQKTLRYQASPTVSQLRSHLNQIADQDKIAEKKAKTYTTIAIICGVLVFVSFFIATGVPTLGVLLMVVSLVAAIIAGIMASRWNRLDIPDLRYRALPGLADILSRDMALNAPLDVNVDFSKPTEKQKSIGKHPWPARKGWKEEAFEDPWLHLSGRFLDNTIFTLHLTELTVKRSGWKRSRSGKSKHKTKTKPKGAEAKLLLKFPRKKYGAITMLNEALPKVVNLPSEVVLKQIKANDHQLLLRVKIPANSAILRNAASTHGLPELFTRMLLSAYQALNLSKTLSKASR